MGQPGDVHHEIARLLADGQWHDYHEIVGKAALVVQPGAAIRACEANRKIRSGGDQRKKQLSISEQVRIGARQIVQTVMVSKAFQIDPPGPQRPYTRKRIRLTPAHLYQRKFNNWSPWLRVAFGLLGDGEWHEIEPVVQAMIDVIPVESLRLDGPGSSTALAARRKALRTLSANTAFEVDRDAVPHVIRIKPRSV